MSASEKILLPDIGDFDSVDVIEVLVEAGDVIDLTKAGCGCKARSRGFIFNKISQLNYCTGTQRVKPSKNS